MLTKQGQGSREPTTILGAREMSSWKLLQLLRYMEGVWLFACLLSIKSCFSGARPLLWSRAFLWHLPLSPQLFLVRSIRNKGNCLKIMSVSKEKCREDRSKIDAYLLATLRLGNRLWSLPLHWTGSNGRLLYPYLLLLKDCSLSLAFFFLERSFVFTSLPLTAS